MKVELIKKWSLPGLRLVPAQFGLAYDVVYDCEYKDHPDTGERVRLKGQDVWLPFDIFDIIFESKPAILCGHVETQEEIEDRIGVSGGDPLGIAVREIMQHLETIHQLAGARAQQIEICKMLLPILQEVEDNIKIDNQIEALGALSRIRLFVKAGTAG